MLSHHLSLAVYLAEAYITFYNMEQHADPYNWLPSLPPQ